MLSISPLILLILVTLSQKIMTLPLDECVFMRWRDVAGDGGIIPAERHVKLSEVE